MTTKSMHCLVRHVQDCDHSHTVAYTVIEHSAMIGMLKSAEYPMPGLECSSYLAQHELNSG